MGKKGNDSKKKNKGPRGKKARAKAQLQRQWGETRQDDTEETKRQGKSRLLSHTTTSYGTTSRKVEAQRVTEPHDEGEGSSEEDSEGENAVTSFLQKLKKSSTERNNTDDSHLDSEMGHVSDNDSRKEEISDDDDTSMDGVPIIDLFSERFSRSPLPENDKDIEQELARVQDHCVVSPQFGLGDGVEIHLSSHWMKQRNLTKENCKSKKMWSKQARSAFECNRSFLKRRWQETTVSTKTKQSSNIKVFDDSFQTIVYPMLASYMDVLFSAEQKSSRKSMTRAITLHILNHVWTSRNRIYKHNKRIKEIKEAVNDSAIDEPSDAHRDQGFTRPTVLVLLPTRGVCFEFVQGMLALMGEGDASISNWDRFKEEFGPPPQAEDVEEAASNEKRRREVLQQKGPEWLELFGDDVNNDDDFKLGIQVNIQAPRVKKATKPNNDESEENSCALKLFSDFYKSDIILASPLGLKMACNKSDEEGFVEDGVDADFLSSIEICSLFRSDVMLMQNWDHVVDLLKMVNKKLKQADKTDFSRVRNYMLAGQACYWRQLIVCSEFADPMILGTFKRFAKSMSGLSRIRRSTLDDQAAIVRVLVNIRQVFQRVPCRSLVDQGAEKLEYFAQNILPDLQKRTHTMIFIPSYFDFVAVRNLLLKREIDFVSVTEYSRVSETSRGRYRFLQGRKPIMLYTGRAHFFLRHSIRGVRHLVFYGVPEKPSFWVDHVNRIGEGLDTVNDMEQDGSRSCLALFTKYESHALERVVGRNNCKRMINSDKLTFLFDSA